nr:MAG TPA: hypothetical protein [Caudoviricetes sp.]
MAAASAASTSRRKCFMGLSSFRRTRPRESCSRIVPTYQCTCPALSVFMVLLHTQPVQL